MVDYQLLAQALAARIRRSGGVIETGVPVTGISESSDGVTVESPAGSGTARSMVVCGGVQADRLARLTGIKIDLQIVPFHGEYFRLPLSRNDIIRHLIYPIPDLTCHFWEFASPG